MTHFSLKNKIAVHKLRPGEKLYLAFVVLFIGIFFGISALWIAANSYGGIDPIELFSSYFRFPLLIALNLLPSILLSVLGFLLFRRCYAAFLCSGTITLLIAISNYFKLQLRGDPLLFSDIMLARTAAGVVGNYSLRFSAPLQIVFALAVILLFFCLLFTPNAEKAFWRSRLLGTEIIVLIFAALYVEYYSSEGTYLKVQNYDNLSPWSETEDYLSRGVIVPFLYSVKDSVYSPPSNYVSSEAERILSSYECSDIPEEQKITVIGVMLEAFSDLTDYECLAEVDEIAEVYAPLHELEENAISGRLYDNIFAGGTVETEWEVLTGYHIYEDFTANTDSYVWYFHDQEYDTIYHHPGYSWFYDREHVNQYLGFDESFFTEDTFGELVDPVAALFHSDGILYDYLLEELDGRTEKDDPLFSFSVTYQNHGPYNTDSINYPVLNRDSVSWSDETFCILNNYLYGVSESIDELVRFTEELEAREDPVVFFTFGDHKPWLGDDKSAYLELGVDFSLKTLDSLSDVFATPYIIYANSAARELLDNDFIGDGGNFSPCYLIMKVFDECGWEGSSFMKMQRKMYSITPMIRPSHVFLQGNQITNLMNDADMSYYRDYLKAEYWRYYNARS